MVAVVGEGNRVADRDVYCIVARNDPICTRRASAEGRQPRARKAEFNVLDPVVPDSNTKNVKQQKKVKNCAPMG